MVVGNMSYSVQSAAEYGQGCSTALNLHQNNCLLFVGTDNRFIFFVNTEFDREHYKVMATADARAAWQRTNRCFAKEETRNDRKCPWCSSPLSSSKSSSYLAPGNPAKGPNNHSPNCIILNKDYDLLMDQKWWLKKPNFWHHLDFMSEQESSFEVELETLTSEFVHKKTDAYGGQKTEVSITEIGKKMEGTFSEEQLWDVSITCAKNEQDSRMQEQDPLIDKLPAKASTEKDIGNCTHLDDDLIGLESLNSLLSMQPRKLSFDLECLWVGSGKTEPWWRTACKDDLASFVARRSQEHIENCDLPRPQTKHCRKRPSVCLENFDHDKFPASFSDQITDIGLSSLDFFAWESPISGCSQNHSDQSYSCNNDHTTTGTNEADIQNNPENTQTRAELLKALHHSQTRAREAEKAALQAYTEKEHIMILFFRQASQLLAYKQWLHLLQLENLCLQLKYKNQPISCIFPTSAPWLPYKVGQRNKDQRRAGKTKHGRPRYNISKGAVAFALGLGLVGAGLLLGWTLGWLFRAA